MQRLPKYILSILMSLSILLSTAGIPVFAHTCNMSGTTDVSVVPEDHGCCRNEPDGITISELIVKNEASCQEEETSCCTLQSGYYKTEAVCTAAQQKDQKQLLPLYLFTALYYSINKITSAEELSNPDPNYSAYAPPSGRMLLNKIRVFRI